MFLNNKTVFLPLGNFQGELDKNLEELGPFDRSPSRTFEPEFSAPIPRPIPEKIKNNPKFQKGKVFFTLIIMAGIFLLFFGSSSFLEEKISEPERLKLFQIFGIILIAWGGIRRLSVSLKGKNLNFIREGKPFIVRVLHSSFSPQGTNYYFFVVIGDFIHPETGDITQRVFFFQRAISKSDQPNLEPTLKPGDLITGIYIPGQFDHTANLYGLLDLNPEVSFLKNKKKSSGKSIFKNPGKIGYYVYLLISFALLLFGYYLYPPHDFHWQNLLLPAIICSLLGIFIFGMIYRSEKNKIDFYKALIVGAWIGLVGVFLLFPFFNGFLDRGKSTFIDVEIIEYWETQNRDSTRDYSIEYKELKTGIISKILVPPQKIDTFMEYDLGYGVLDVKPGFFKIPWDKSIYPHGTSSHYS